MLSSYALYRLYGMTSDQFDKMRKTQRDRCKICNKAFKSNREPAIDHDHETGRIRGLLCLKCNSGLGFFNDDIRTLAMAIVYLEDNGKLYV